MEHPATTANPWVLVRTEYDGIVIEAVNIGGGAPYPTEYRISVDDVGLVRKLKPVEFRRLVELMRAADFAPSA